MDRHLGFLDVPQPSDPDVKVVFAFSSTITIITTTITTTTTTITTTTFSSSSTPTPSPPTTIDLCNWRDREVPVKLQRFCQRLDLSHWGDLLILENFTQIIIQHHKLVSISSPGKEVDGLNHKRWGCPKSRFHLLLNNCERQSYSSSHIIHVFILTGS